MTDSNDPAALCELLSALVDGELADAQAADACLHWRGGAEVRASWHAYQLIGDALRSDDLCSAPGHDAAFLAAFRARLAAEPVVLAPQVVTATLPPAAGVAASGRRPWRASMAIAAGFFAVVGVVVATRFTAPGTAGVVGDAPSTLARSDAGPAVGAAVPVSAVAGPAPALDARGSIASGQLIRDVRLDRYLSAHKQFAGSSALGVPSGFLRNATADAADR